MESGSINPNISSSLQAFEKASDMWTHQQNFYHQVNKAQKFFLDTELAKYSQGDRSVQEYYNGFLVLWNEKDAMTLAEVRKEAKPDVIEILEESHTSQFFMNLRP